jgi:hypothetical protein
MIVRQTHDGLHSILVKSKNVRLVGAVEHVFDGGPDEIREFFKESLHLLLCERAHVRYREAAPAVLIESACTFNLFNPTTDPTHHMAAAAASRALAGGCSGRRHALIFARAKGGSDQYFATTFSVGDGA